MPYADVRFLIWLNRRQRHVYAGTVPVETIAKRRAKNKAARRSRRINRT